MKGMPMFGISALSKLSAVQTKWEVDMDYKGYQEVITYSGPELRSYKTEQWNLEVVVTLMKC